MEKLEHAKQEVTTAQRALADLRVRVEKAKTELGRIQSETAKVDNRTLESGAQKDKLEAEKSKVEIAIEDLDRFISHSDSKETLQRIIALCNRIGNVSEQKLVDMCKDATVKLATCLTYPCLGKVRTTTCTLKAPDFVNDKVEGDFTVPCLKGSSGWKLTEIHVHIEYDGIDKELKDTTKLIHKVEQLNVDPASVKDFINITEHGCGPDGNMYFHIQVLVWKMILRMYESKYTVHLPLIEHQAYELKDPASEFFAVLNFRDMVITLCISTCYA
ncbi:MAG TPA: hypothetical protein VFQ26_06420 [Nitrospiraceae bacterium]|nr:hypothetical protein [Nitrospiraceae bacterium]